MLCASHRACAETWVAQAQGSLLQLFQKGLAMTVTGPSPMTECSPEGQEPFLFIAALDFSARLLGQKPLVAQVAHDGGGPSLPLAM